ncbi:MAG: thiamine-binding protein [Bacteroidia bacterium]|nr:thiamine-binding protein [Bacteroidia bacterium]
MTNQILAGIQILPKGKETKAEEAYKKAVSVIEQSGLHFKKDNFEIVLEGNFEQVMRILEAIQLTSFNAGADEILLNIKIHAKNGKDVKLNSQ